MTKCKNVLITGCNRPNGIGFGLVKQFLERLKPEHVFATCRNPSDAKELNELAANYGNLHVLELDVTNTESFSDVVAQVDKVTGGEGLNVFVNNSGIMEGTRDTISGLRKEVFIKHFEVNTLAPLFLTQAFLPLLEKAAKMSSAPVGLGKCAVINVTTKMASIDDNTSGGSYYYRSSKTALNMASKSLSHELKGKGIVTLLIHPGWVQTEMGGKNALITTEHCVASMVTVFEKMGADDNGKFVQYDGKEIPW